MKRRKLPERVRRALERRASNAAGKHRKTKDRGGANREAVRRSKDED